MDHSDVSLYVMTPEFGAATQLEKSTCFADLIAINKFDKRGSLCFERCKKQYQRNHNLWDVNLIHRFFWTIAFSSMIRMNTLYKAIMDKSMKNKF
jgi:methylmalonyl-CoA mutase